jgi:hypothetical protein
MICLPLLLKHLDQGKQNLDCVGSILVDYVPHPRTYSHLEMLIPSPFTGAEGGNKSPLNQTRG